MPIKSRASSVPAGMVEFYAANAVPPGWLKANGATVSRTAYAALFLAIGTTYGAGDGSTTFKLPDLRGEFPRGLDDGRGVDIGRGLGVAQADSMQGHFHNHVSTGAQVGIPDPLTTGNSTQNNAGGSYYAYRTATTHAPVSDGSNGAPRISAETRPRNVALLACIKF